MNCQQAKEQIDEAALRMRGDSTLVRESLRAPDANNAALDAHLASCAACREYRRSVAATDKLLAGVRTDRPTNEEMATMWNTLALSLPGQGMVTATSARKPRPILRLALYAASVAAVLLVAAQLGSMQYGGELWIPGWSALSSARLVSEMRFERQGHAILSDVNSDVPNANDPSGWGTPVHPSHVAKDQVLAQSAGALRKTKLVPGDGRAGGERPTDTQTDYAVDAGRPPVPGLSPPPPVLVAAPPQSSPTMEGGASRFAAASIPKENLDQLVEQLAPSKPRRRARMGGSSIEGLGETKVESEVAASDSEQLVVAGNQPGLFNRAITFELYNDASSENQGGGGATGQATPDTGEASNVPSSAKIIRTGKLVVEVPSYTDSAAQVEQIVAKHRGFIGDSNVVEATGGAITGTLVIRVPAEQFEGLFAALKALGRIVSEHSDAADVTAQYVDLEARIASHRVTEERLHELVRNKTIVDKVSSLLEVERELQRVRSEIEQMQGELRVMGDRVALSTITLALSEPKRIVPSASLSVEVQTVEEAGAKLGATLEAIDGRLVSGKTSKRSDGSLTATYQLQAPLSRFGEILAAISGMGRIEERQVSDREFTQINEPWAAKVQCNIALTVFERSRQLPSGTMFVQAEDIDAAVQQLEALLEPAGARIVSNYSMVDPQGVSKAEVSLSVPAAQFADLVSQLARLGRVSSQTVTGETQNIAGGAASVLCNLRLTITEVVREVPTGQIVVEVEKFDAARTAISTLLTEKKLQVLDSSSQQNHDGSWTAGFELGVEAKDMEAVVGRLESLGRVVSRNMQGIGLGSLSRTDPDALGHLGVQIAEKSAIAPAPEQAGQTLRTHFRDGLEGLYKSVGLIAYGLIVMGPWLAIAILLGWLISRVRRQRTKATP